MKTVTPGPASEWNVPVRWSAQGPMSKVWRSAIASSPSRPAPSPAIVVAQTFAVSKLPSQLSFEDATTLPVAFLTAYYSLVHLARLEPGETVLIHGGAGAVGLAAMQIAKHRGATVIATAGSGEKRALLRNLGADFVSNSRTLAFADEVMSFTERQGRRRRAELAGRRGDDPFDGLPASRSVASSSWASATSTPTPISDCGRCAAI